MEYLKQPPQPLFDKLDYLDNHASRLTLQAEQQKDYFHACQFLRMYRGSEATFNAYRREIERLLQWTWRVANKNLPAIKRTDIEQWVEFCQRPPNAWIGVKQAPRFLNIWANGSLIRNGDLLSRR